MSKHVSKFNVMAYLSILIAVFTMFIGTSYSYYIKKSNEKENQKVIIKKLNMLLKYNEGNQINRRNILPGFEDEYTFSIENFSDELSGNYKIIFEIINPLTDNEDNNFIYELSSKTDNDDTIINSEGIIPVEDMTLGSASISPRSIHEYKLKIKLLDNNDQNYLKGKTFISKIKVINEIN